MALGDGLPLGEHTKLVKVNMAAIDPWPRTAQGKNQVVALLHPLGVRRDVGGLAVALNAARDAGQGGNLATVALIAHRQRLVNGG